MSRGKSKTCMGNCEKSKREHFHCMHAKREPFPRPCTRKGMTVQAWECHNPGRASLHLPALGTSQPSYATAFLQPCLPSSIVHTDPLPYFFTENSPGHLAALLQDRPCPSVHLPWAWSLLPPPVSINVMCPTPVPNANIWNAMCQKEARPPLSRAETARRHARAYLVKSDQNMRRCETLRRLDRLHDVPFQASKRQKFHVQLQTKVKRFKIHMTSL